MRRPKVRTVNKQDFKRIEGKCRICGNTDYAVLDVHRLLPGSEGGKYTTDNSAVLCACCHRLVHEGAIKILGYRHSTAGRLLHIVHLGTERFV